MKVFSKNKREMWISNNRVLVGGSKKVTGRNPNFDTEETRLLISLWGDPKIQKTLITTHKKHAVIARLADKMRDYGYQRSAEEINTRIKNLKCFYNRIKKDMETGSNSEPTWKHYSSMDEIMTRPIFSVRPNEIPKPSLRYKLEEAKREREERGETLDEIEEAELLKSLQQGEERSNVEDVINNNSRSSEMDTGNSVGDCGNGDVKNDSEIDDDNDTSHEDDQNIYDEDMDYEPINNNNNNKNKKDKSSPPLRLTRSRRSEIIKNYTDESEQNDIQNSIDMNQNSIDIGETSIIKDEPIDVDDDSNDEKLGDDDKGSDSYPLADYIKATIKNSSSTDNTKISTNNNNLSGNESQISQIITTVAASLGTSSSPTTATSIGSPLKIGPATSIVAITSNHSINNNSTTISNTQAKISLVPTNFLLKPQSQNIQQDIQQPQQQQQKQPQKQHNITTKSLQGIQINRQIPIRPKPSQPHIIYTHQSNGNQQTSNGIVNTSNGPMKVLLVNALQKNSQNVQNMVTPTGSILQNKSVDISNNTLYQSSGSTIQSNISNIKLPQTTSVSLNGLVSSTSSEKMNLLGTATISGKGTIGYRALLGQLIKTQEESNQIQRERLQLERERLEYEKSAGERFLNFLPGIMPNIFSLFQQKPEQQQQQPIQPEHLQKEQTMTTQSVFITTPIVSAIEKSSSNHISTNTNASEINENTPIILLTPKKEKDDN